jgi:hypothetical protein
LILRAVIEFHSENVSRFTLPVTEPVRRIRSDRFGVRWARIWVQSSRTKNASNINNITGRTLRRGLGTFGKSEMGANQASAEIGNSDRGRDLLRSFEMDLMDLSGVLHLGKPLVDDGCPRPDAYRGW